MGSLVRPFVRCEVEFVFVLWPGTGGKVAVLRGVTSFLPSFFPSFLPPQLLVTRMLLTRSNEEVVKKEAEWVGFPISG